MSHWLDNAIFYEIYPQSFQDSNSDGIGDFQGIISRLDYIQSLGCNAIWMNPCYESPFNDAGYDISNYYRAAPRYGTNEDLIELFDAVHDRGMHILLDLVPGHTSSNHSWFKESIKPERNEFSDRYIWTSNIWTDVDSNPDPQIRGWLKGISSRDGAVALNFFASQPALNYGYAEPTEPWQQSVDAPGPRATVEAIKDVMKFWLQLGCDGFRVDMAYSLVKRDPGHRATIALWQGIRKFMDESFPDAVLISEWGNPGEALRGGFHMDFLLHFGESHYMDLFRAENPYFRSDGKGVIRPFVETYQQYYRDVEQQGLICIPSGNHDMTRIAHHLSEAERKVAFAFLLSMPGAPFIYYGDEIGMRYLKDMVSVEGGYDRTGARSPMQWCDQPNAGFSTAPAEDLYMKIDPDPNRPTVQSQYYESESFLNYVKRLIQLRQETEPLQTNGKIEFLLPKKGEFPLAYRRIGESGAVLVLLNPRDEAVDFPCSDALGEIILEVGGGVEIEDGKHVRIAGASAAWIYYAYVL